MTNTLAAPQIAVSPKFEQPEPHELGDEGDESILASLTQNIKTAAVSVPDVIFQLPFRIYKYLFGPAAYTDNNGSFPG